ncbi:ribonuclease III [Acidithiobacillus sp. IBUN Pt1247-S3]|uniref:ribonuclease III n=1 Tax=Acidithiobacillus sp. IBUN Pt1247-S3 TaxID=3166642 RepID=UPI0034E5CEBA
MNMLDRLQDRIAYRFQDLALLRQALTHRSAAALHNERLEFLGDAALNFVVAARLYERFPKVSEGDLSRMRARLVREETLAQVAESISVADALILGAGELRSGGARRVSIRADAVEAILGAAYLDGGFAAAETIVDHLIVPLITDALGAEELRDPKTRLQELLQGKGRALPFYELIEEKGQAHERRFVARCSVDGTASTEAEDSSRRKAEQQAAQLMLDQLQGLLSTQRHVG